MSGLSVLSLSKFMLKRPSTARLWGTLREWHRNAAGYRKLGLKYDDLIAEESVTVQKALKRLTAQQQYDRVFRMRRAMQLSLSHQILPVEQQTKPEEDDDYLQPYIEEIEKEEAERSELEAMVIQKRSNKH